MPEDKHIQELFTEMVRESGMPVTDAEMKRHWEELNKNENSLIRNESSFSPFWRLISAIVTKPSQWLLNLLVNHALPNTFVRFAKGIYLDVLCWGVDIERKKASPAKGQVRFYRAGTHGVLKIPAESFIETPPINGNVYRIFTLEDLFIPEGQDYIDAKVQAEKEGEAYNLGPGYYSILSQAINGIVDVKNHEGWLHEPGADAESDESLRLRYQNQFSAVGQLHHDAAYKVIIASFAGIRMDYIIFEKDGPRGPGTANAYIMIESGIPTEDFCNKINEHIRDSGHHGHGDDLLCMPINPINVDLKVTVHAVEGASENRQNKLLNEVENRIRCAFRQNTDYKITRTLPLSRFSFSRLSDELHDALPDLKSIEFHRGLDLVANLELPILKSLELNGGWGE